MKAFISSTVTDLAEYRSVVRDVLSDLGVQYVTLNDLIGRDFLTSKSADQVFEQLDTSDLRRETSLTNARQHRARFFALTRRRSKNPESSSS